MAPNVGLEHCFRVARVCWADEPSSIRTYQYTTRTTHQNPTTSAEEMSHHIPSWRCFLLEDFLKTCRHCELCFMNILNIFLYWNRDYYLCSVPLFCIWMLVNWCHILLAYVILIFWYWLIITVYLVVGYIKGISGMTCFAIIG